jgi:hypothetical protein
LPRAQWEQLASVTTPLAHNPFTYGLLNWVGSEAHSLLLNTDGVVAAKRFNTDGSVTPLQLPAFVADSALRQQVAITVAKLPAEANWKVAALKEGLRDELREVLDTYLPESSAIKYKDLDTAAQEWRATEQALIRTLSF